MVISDGVLYFTHLCKDYSCIHKIILFNVFILIIVPVTCLLATDEGDSQTTGSTEEFTPLVLQFLPSTITADSKQ